MNARLSPPTVGAMFLTSFFRQWWTKGVIFAGMLLVTGCNKQASEGSLSPVGRAGRGDSEAPTPPEGRGDPSVFLARVPAGSLGPRLAFSSGKTVVVWADTAGEEPGLYSIALGRDGRPLPSRRVARVDPSARQLSIGWTNTGDVLVSTVHKKAGEQVLSATRLSSEGVYEFGPQVLATTPSPILYTKIVPTALGAVVIWVERTATAAELYTILIDEKGPRRPTLQARDISAWQVVSRGGTTALVTREGANSPSLMFRHLGVRGETMGAPVELSRHVAGGKDLDVAMNRDHILVAWSEEGAYHSELKGTLLDMSGNIVRTPFALTAPSGDQTLVSLQAGEESEAFDVAWREPLEAHHGRPQVFVGRLTRDEPVAVPRYRLNVAREDARLPLFAAQGDELAALMDFRCQSVDCSGHLERASVLFSEEEEPLGRRLRVEGRSPTLAWDLTCSGENCLYLMSEGSTESRVYLATLDAQTPLDGAIAALTTTESPRLARHTTLAEIPELAELSGASWEGGARTLLAWVSYFSPDTPYVIPKEPAPDGRLAPVQARLTTVVPAGGGSKGEESKGGESQGADTKGVETILSYRARSLGGVHLIAPQENRGLVLWSALDEKKPRLFATLVDAAGGKISQKMLTRTDGEVTDVTGVRVPGGYLLAWVDGTGAAPRVLALRVSDTLMPVGAPRIVTERSVSPSGVTLLATGDGVRCVWSDARDSGAAETSHLYGALLDVATGDRRGPEQQLTSGEQSASAPRLVKSSEGSPILAWISESSVGFASLKVGVLSADGSLSNGRSEWAKEGDVRDFSFECGERGECRAAVLLEEGEESETRLTLWALSGVSPSSKEVRETLAVPLWALSAEGVSPVLLGGDIYYADRAYDGSGWHLRRATIAWD